MEIRKLTQAYYKQYHDFLMGKKESLIYYSLEYRNLLVNLLQCDSDYLIVVEKGNILGILPLMIKNGKYGKIINSLPFFGSNGGILAADKEAYRLLLKEYNKIVNNKDAAAATLISNPLIDQDYSQISCDLTDKRIGQWTLIPNKEDPEESLMNSFHYKTRNMIRKGQKSGIIVQKDNGCMEFIKNTHIENMKAIGGKSKSNLFFSLVGSHFQCEIDYNIYTASKDGQLIAGLLAFYFNQKVEYFTPVVKKEFRTFQPLSLIIYHAMIDAAQKGFTWWNWGGTWLTQEGVYRFKKRWGAIDKEYTYYTKINNREIFNNRKEDLLYHYDNFYVIDFKKLHSCKD